MEQIHIKVMQEHNLQLFRLIGKENHLDHIYSAFLCRENVLDFKRDYRVACLYFEQEKELKLEGLKFDDVSVAGGIMNLRREGKRAFGQALYFAILEELRQHADYFIYNKWPYLAYAHLGEPDFKERFAQAYGAFELETRMKKKGIPAPYIDDENFQMLYHEAINAYHFYTDGIC
ncbi:hypothetical protein [Pontibacter russatus]|uniref:hypothetical protein n=1 Tax=Pontibacter russatus TaxID=2694929 RepID=UPI00137A20E3|nr:hypothetical protein [Pontibacter russatus]